jgi:hypothetical protein
MSRRPRPGPAIDACELVLADCIGADIQVKERKAGRSRALKGQEQLQHRYPARVTRDLTPSPAKAREYGAMSDKPEPSKAEPAAQGGVFGNLPDARPGTRSPRRKSAGKAKAKATSKATAKPKQAKPAPQATPKATPPPKAAHVPKPPPSRPNEAEPRRPGPEQQPGGLADVAWAGIAVAAEAATIGVRLASRAIDAVRGNSERD